MEEEIIKTTPFLEGPYIQAACFCQMAFPDNAGSLSLIRLIDTVNITGQGPNPPKDMPPATINLNLVLMLKSGNSQGRYEIKIVPELPNGSSLDPQIYSIRLEGEEKGHNLIISIAFTFSLEGLYWFWVYFDDERFTAIPIRIKYDRIIHK
jgi:hypothetical protein